MIDRTRPSRGRTRAAGGTAVVTLESCNHIGRTSACRQLRLEAGVARVVIALIDPTSRGEGGAAVLGQSGRPNDHRGIRPRWPAVGHPRYRRPTGVGRRSVPPRRNDRRSLLPLFQIVRRQLALAAGEVGRLPLSGPSGRSGLPGLVQRERGGVGNGPGGRRGTRVTYRGTRDRGLRPPGEDAVRLPAYPAVDSLRGATATRFRPPCLASYSAASARASICRIPCSSL
jgi:hypothetical protein